VRFDRDGRYRATVVDRIRDQNIVDLDVDARGRLWVLDGEQNRVLRFGLDGTAEGVKVRHDWRQPEALAVDSIGNVYVLDREAKTVDVFGPDGAALHSVGPVLGDGTELRRPRDLAVDGSGRLYIVDGDPAAVLILE
jgi:sugar lactone lactonase YvrE